MTKIKKLLITVILATFFATTIVPFQCSVYATDAPKSGTSSASGSSSSTKNNGTQKASTPSGPLNNVNFQFDLRAVTHDDINTQGWIRRGINFIFERAIAIMAATVGSAAVLMMVVGGFMMMLSAGRQDWYDRGKSYLLKSIIGLAAVLGAYVIVTTVQLVVRSLFS